MREVRFDTVAISGNCYICGKTVDRDEMKGHIAIEHSAGEEACFLLEIESIGNENYWLYIDVPYRAKLSTIDKFLRNIWLECCGHLSVFLEEGTAKIGKDNRIGGFEVGDMLVHEYDMGSTTETAITIVAEIARPTQKATVRLIARNNKPEAVCDSCGKPATQIHAWEYNAYCDDCAEKHEDYEEAFLPFVNSPRTGVCGYTGELDKYEFEAVKKTDVKNTLKSRTSVKGITEITAAKNTYESKTPLTGIEKKGKLLNRYATAAGFLYGVISIPEFVDVFNHYEDDKTSEQEVISVLAPLSKTTDVDYSMREGLIAGPDFLLGFPDDFDGALMIRERQKGKARYLPNKKEFLRFESGDYSEPEEPYAKLKAYILENELCLQEGFEGVDGDLFLLREMIQSSMSASVYIQHFIDSDYPLHDINVLNAFLQEIIECYNNTRMYENNGFTPNELCALDKIA